MALVTGGDSGIGSACAKALAAAGADVAVTYLHDADGARETADAVRAAGRRALPLRSDARDEVAVEACFDQVEQELETVDILVTSAGINTYGIEVAKLTLEQWENMLKTDLTGTFLASRQFVRSLREKKMKGAVIAISSVHAEVVRSGSSAYASAKAGVKNFVETLGVEVAPDDITVNAIAPGMILTPMNEAAEKHWSSSAGPPIVQDVLCRHKNFIMYTAAQVWYMGKTVPRKVARSTGIRRLEWAGTFDVLARCVRTVWTTTSDDAGGCLAHPGPSLWSEPRDRLLS